MNVWIVSSLVAANVLINVTGTVLIKHAAVNANPIAAIAGVACYSMAASLFVAMAAEQPLHWLAVTTSVLSLVAISLIGVLVYDENLAPLHLAGIAFALIAVALISTPGASQ